MSFQIDQSGRIEQTNKVTIIAFSNGKDGTIKLSSRDKKTLQSIFRKAKKLSSFVIQVFAAVVYLLLEKYKVERTLIIIDQEYFGHENLIRSYLIQLSQNRNRIKLNPDNVRFELVGKTSKVHTVAYKAFKRNRADFSINYEDVMAMVLLYKK